MLGPAISKVDTDRSKFLLSTFGPSPHFQYAFLALLAMALHQGELLIAIDGKRTWDGGGERDRPAFSGRDFFPDIQSGLRIIDDDIVRHDPRHALKGQFDWLPGGHDKMVRSKCIAVGFYHRSLDAVGIDRNADSEGTACERERHQHEQAHRERDSHTPIFTGSIR